MSDPIIIENDSTFEALTLDWLLSPFDPETELADAVVVALGTDARADDDERLPHFDATDRRGWWGNLEADELFGGWDIGCRLWLLSRAKILPAEAEEGETLGRVEGYILEALEPFVSAGIASGVTANAIRIGESRIDAEAIMIRGPRRAIVLRFQALWTGVI